MNVYILKCASGEYETYEERIVAVYNTRTKALQRALNTEEVLTTKEDVYNFLKREYGEEKKSNFPHAPTRIYEILTFSDISVVINIINHDTIMIERFEVE